ncbi:flavin reductase [Corticibacter populi]|uniref:Flavin reductase n=1 Tax=Corticibacter populi TaxID=1550736 RepID=A0A3M6QX58_9BURK|nr:flavin reductase [Corticibacter populi]RMX07597.1 flavin reductase [Corticibacter populi]RZS30095.1 flavin reductase [Corticibacter populi]
MTEPTPAPIDTQDFRGALALLTGAVNLITTDGPAGLAGFTASAVCSVTDSPPTILVCMRTAAWSNPVFHGNGVLCVNVLTSAQKALSGQFANPGLSQQERFDCAQWDRLASGAPALRGALVNLDCAIDHVHQVGTHDVCFCRVLDIRTQPEGEGLVYFNRNYHQVNRRSAMAA